MTFDDTCRDFGIDPLRLEEEWTRHPQRVYTAAMRAATAEMEHEQAKKKLKLIGARLAMDIRLRPSHYEALKSTDAAVQEAMIVQPEYQEAEAEVIAKQYALNDVRASVESLEHTKRALTMLVELWIKEYYSNPQQRTQLGPMSDVEKSAIRTSGQRRMAEAREGDNVAE